MKEVGPSQEPSWIEIAAAEKVAANKVGMNLDAAEQADLFDYYVAAMEKKARSRPQSLDTPTTTSPTAPSNDHLRRPDAPRKSSIPETSVDMTVEENESEELPEIEQMPALVIDTYDPRYWQSAKCYDAEEQLFADPAFRSVAAAYCAKCVVQRECLIYQLKYHTTHNYRAGFTDEERAMVRAQLAPGMLDT